MGLHSNISISKHLFFLFIIMAVVLRMGTFLPSVINHDESTYILIGNGILQGQTYLVDSIDTKPVGIFLIYAVLNFLSGGSIFFMRMLTAVIIGITAYLISKLTQKASGQAIAGQAAGIIYIFLTSIFKFYGLSPNTELFFVPFAIGAIYLAWGRDRLWWHFLLAGFLLGMGFMIKYVIAADALALGLMLLWLGWKYNHIQKAVIQFCLSLSLGFVMPMLMVYAYYHSIGQLDSFLFYTFDVSSSYPVHATWGKRFLFVLDFFGRFFPFTLLAIAAWRKGTTQPSDWKHFLILWLLCVTIVTLLPGKTFGHYQIQMMPVLAILAGHWFVSIHSPVSKLEQWWAKNGRWTTGTIWLLLGIGLYMYYANRPDKPREVAALIAKRIVAGDRIYTGDYHQIVYHLLELEPTTAYVHPSLLFYENHIKILNIDLKKEAEHIVGQSPRYILLRKNHKNNVLTDYIYDYYYVSDTLINEVLLLEEY